MTRPIIFIAIWFILSLLQAAFVRLTSDEGYYWFFSTHLQWGYYDHPPIVAAMIKAGYSIFKNELGVRLMNVVIVSASLLLFFTLLPPRLRKTHVAVLLLLSQPLLHYFSIIVFPDAPLIFFSLLFLFGYKRWLDHNDLTSAVLMGVSMAGMLYSKYHGLLLVLLTIISNFQLLRSKWFWMATGLALVISLPHFWWQLQNGFPSFDYHLTKRAGDRTGFHFAGEYISQMILALGPILLFAVIVSKPDNVFEKALQYIVWGSIAFFLLISFRRFIHFHWISIAIFPAIYLAARVFENKKREVVFYLLIIPAIMIILFFRVHTVRSFLPFSPRDIGFYQNRDKWATEVSAFANDRPVVFINNFREAGLYNFYTNKTGVALFNNDDRKTQYDLWCYEDSLQGKPALIIEKRKYPQYEEFKSEIGKKVFYREISLFQSYYNIPVKIRTAETKNDSLHLSLSIINTRSAVLRFLKDPEHGSPKLIYRIIGKNKDIIRTDILKTFDDGEIISPNAERAYYFTIPFLDKIRDHWIEIGFEASGLPVSINGRKSLK